jgi:ABC-type transporter Mla subunit MlaD
MVGLFLVGGLAGLTWLIIKFGEAPTWLVGGKTYPVPVYFANVSGVIEGDPVYMKGVRIGNVSKIGFRDEEHPEQGVVVGLDIQQRWRVPRTAQVAVELAAIGFARPIVRVIVPSGPSAATLPTDGSVPLMGETISAFDALFPPEVVNNLQKAASQIGNLAEALTPVARDLHELFQPRDVDLVDNPKVGAQKLSANLHTAVQRLDTGLKHFNEVIGDPNVRSDLRISIQNFKTISEQGKAIMEDMKKVATQARFVAEDAKDLTGKLGKTVDNANSQLDKVARVIIDDAEKLGRFFDQLEVAGRNMAEGKGSAGKFLNDPELYDAMVITMKRLQLAIEDMNNLVKQWQREGMNVKGVGLIK